MKKLLVASVVTVGVSVLAISAQAASPRWYAGLNIGYAVPGDMSVSVTAASNTVSIGFLFRFEIGYSRNWIKRKSYSSDIIDSTLNAIRNCVIPYEEKNRFVEV